MALMIESTCINCDMCELECPNQAIYMGKDVYEIKAESCTECVGHYDTPQCQDVCPIDCVIADPNHQEDQDTLMVKFASLTGLLDEANTALN